MTRLLPEFERPPLTEVALSVQFEKIDQLQVPQLGLLWASFRDRFPHTEQHPPLTPVFERFGIRPTADPTPNYDLLSILPNPRVWFVNEAQTELVQIQSDRFIRNWRTRTESDSYPRYAKLRERFADDYSAFESVINAELSTKVEPNQCEVTYVNLVAAPNGSFNPHDSLSRVCPLFQEVYSEHPRNPIDQATVSLKYLLGTKSSPLGRLHVDVVPVFQVSSERKFEPKLRISLTARGSPESQSIDGIMAFFDLGHESIVNTFAAITTKELHEHWGRTS